MSNLYYQFGKNLKGQKNQLRKRSSQPRQRVASNSLESSSGKNIETVGSYLDDSDKKFIAALSAVSDKSELMRHLGGGTP